VARYWYDAQHEGEIMTCIAAVVDGDHVLMCGDSAGVGGGHTVVRRDPKVFACGPYVLGFTSSFRMGDLLRYMVALPEIPTAEVSRRFMVQKFIPVVRHAFTHAGYSQKNNNVETAGTFLVGVHNRIFRIDDDYQVGESAEPFDTVGAGHCEALATLWVLNTGLQVEGLTKRNWLTIALKAADQYNAYVRPPFRFAKGAPCPAH
jgi:hypothetical protein